MPAVADICNIAISHCGTRSKIQAIDEGSPEANACLTHFDQARDATLRAYDWNFARITDSLAPLTNPPARWSYIFAEPSDCITIRRLNDTPLLLLPETFFEKAAIKDASGAFKGVLLTNQPSLSAIYTARVVDPARWDVGFADAMALSLAWRVCFELTGKEERVKALMGLWQGFEGRAAAEMANEGSQPNRTYVPESLRARGYDDGLAVWGESGCWPWPR